MNELLWKYLIGPVVADAKNVEQLAWHGATAHPGYNPVNTAVYALVAALILYSTYRLFQRKNVELDSTTALYSIPFMFLGGALRFLEDASAVPYPYNIVLITPLIYIAVALIYVPAVYYLKNKQLSILGTALALPVILLAFLQVQSLNWPYIGLTLVLTAVLTWAYSWIAKEEYSTAPMVAMAGSQFFGGSASMLSTLQFFGGYTPKQLLASSLYSILGPIGVLLMKLGVVVLAASIVTDLEEGQVRGIAFLTLYAIGLGTGFRVFLRVLAGI